MEWYAHYKSRIDDAIAGFFDGRYADSGKTDRERLLEEAIRYAVEGNGKRIRAVLVRLAYEAGGGFPSDPAILRAAVAIECVHAYTLVHDDLPCMDNDELRRGRPTVWKAYGEDVALLVGDALNTLAFELMADTGSVEAVRLLARAMGDLGVVRGQMKDMTFDRYSDDVGSVLGVHREKTGVFIEAALAIGRALSPDPSRVDPATLSRYARAVGLAFQVSDDLLDAVGDALVVGKAVGKDADRQKGLVSLLGIDAVRAMLDDLERDALAAADGLADPRLRELAHSIANRTK